MNTDNSIASFWDSFPWGEKAAKLLAGRAMPPAAGTVAGSAHADENPEEAMLEVLEYHQ